MVQVDGNNDEKDDSNEMIIACLNSRSINNKTTALVDLFDEMKLSVCLITETWMSSGPQTEARLDDLLYGEDLGFFTKNREGRRGGGVAIAYNTNKMRIREFELQGFSRAQEAVAAIGTHIETGMEVFFVAIYLPPAMKKKDVDQICELLSNNISQVKTAHPSIYIALGGDINKKKIQRAVSDFPLVKKLNTGPTRGRHALDVIFTDLPNTTVDVVAPIETEDLSLIHI